MAGEFELKKKALKRETDTPSQDKPEVSAGKSVNRPADASRPGSSKPAAKGKAAAGAGPVAQSTAREPDREESSAEIAAAGKEKRRSLLSRKGIFYTGIALGVVLIASTIYLFVPSNTAKSNLAGDQPQKPEPVTSITRPIPIPDYREMLDFLVLNETQGQKTLTLFRMEVAYHSPTRYKNFKEQNVVFRDTIYSFLLMQNSSRNTTRSWHNVIEKELLDFIRVKLPQSHADGIKLTQVENL